MTALLEIRGLSKRFRGVDVLSDVDFSMATGELHCLIGPNGAGKSTLFRLICGLHDADAGTIRLCGADITNAPTFRRVRQGISAKFQTPGLFRSLTVWENLETAMLRHVAPGDIARTIDCHLAFLGLAADAEKLAGSLSHGKKQLLEIGMAISLSPRLLLLDEPAAGLSPEETYAIGEVVRTLNRQGVTILAVEHDMKFVRQVAIRVTVMNLGRIFAQGPADAIMTDERVRAIYLGGPV